MAKKQEYTHTLKVQFGALGVGDHTVGIGFSFDRSMDLIPNELDAILCGKRLDVYAVVGEPPDPSQQQFEGMEGESRPHAIASADVPSIKLTPKQVSGRLTFSLEEVDAEAMLGLAKRSGTLMIRVRGDIPKQEPEKKKKEAPRLTAPPAAEPVTDRSTTDQWSETPIEELVRYGLTDHKASLLRESVLEIGTVGKLEKTIDKDPQWHRKITGMGEKAIDKLTDALLAFRLEHPIKSQEDLSTEATPEETQGQGGDGDEDADTECSIENLETEQIESSDQDRNHGEHWAVRVFTAPGEDGKFRSCFLCVRGETVEGMSVPVEESQPFDDRAAAYYAAAVEAAESMAEWSQDVGQHVQRWAVEKWIMDPDAEDDESQDPETVDPDQVPETVPFTTP